MSNEIWVTHYSLHREQVKKNRNTSYYTDSFSQEECLERAEGWKTKFVSFHNEDTGETVYIERGVGVLNSEEELFGKLAERLGEKREKLTELQDEYINKVKETISGLDKLGLLTLSNAIDGASVSKDKEGFSIYQHFTKLPTLRVSSSKEIQIDDSLKGISW